MVRVVELGGVVGVVEVVGVVRVVEVIRVVRWFIGVRKIESKRSQEQEQEQEGRWPPYDHAASGW